MIRGVKSPYDCRMLNLTNGQELVEPVAYIKQKIECRRAYAQQIASDPSYLSDSDAAAVETVVKTVDVDVYAKAVTRLIHHISHQLMENAKDVTRADIAPVTFEVTELGVTPNIALVHGSWLANRGVVDDALKWARSNDLIVKKEDSTFIIKC